MNLIQKQIKEASQKYYTDGTSNLTDEEFDNLLEKEKKENPNSELLKVGHGYDVYEDTTYGEKVDHKYGLVGSLPKCKIYKDFISTFKGVEHSKFIASTKLDGLSVVLYFEKGKFVQAITRGNGHVGIDITNKIQYITKLDKILDETFTGGIRGEIVMSFENFKKFHEIHPESKNARNSVAGLMNNKELTSDLDFVDVVFYTIIGDESHQFKYYYDILNYLKLNLVNQKIVKYTSWSLRDINNDVQLLQFMHQLKDNWYGDYPYDGIVNAADDIEYDDSAILYTSNAFKFKAESKETIVTNIDWNLSKTGYLIPRIQFEPIELSGATVQYCAGHNAQNIQDIKVGIGSRIKVTRSNEVIPYLEEVITEKDYEIPIVCPSCGTKMIMNGVHLQCPNRECKNTDVQDALIWMSVLVPVDGLGDTLKLKYLCEYLGEDNISVENIYKAGPIQNTYSQYVKEKLFNETYNRLFTDQFSLDSAILALNIPRFGDITASKLAKYPEEIQKLYIEGNAKLNQFERLHYMDILRSIGNANYESLSSNEHKMRRLNFIKDQIVWSSKFGSDYRGDVCITGRLSVKRSIFEEELKNAGYVPVSSVKKDTKYLITDDPNSGSSKNKNADKYNIPKITEKEFRTRFM